MRIVFGPRSIRWPSIRSLHAAPPAAFAGLEHEDLSTGAPQRRRSREPGDASADDDALDVGAHAPHPCASCCSAHVARLRAASVKARTPSTGVSGRQP